MGTNTDKTFTPTIASITDNQTINLLLFTNDITAIGLVLDAGNTTSILIAGLVSPTYAVPFFTTDVGGPGAVFVPTGESGNGYVGAVKTNGFPAKAVNVVAGTSTKVEIVIVTNGAKIQSPISLLNWDLVTFSGDLPVLIPAATYSQTIQDAGNQIIGAGNTTYQVVGLYNVV
jgi:hypothetical protein